MRAPLRIALKAIVISAAIIGIVLALAQDQDTLRVRSAMPVSDPRFAEYVGALMGAVQTTNGNRYEVLVNGDQIFPAMLQAIGAARRRISFETYIYSSGAVAAKFTSALAAAARRGVEVRIVFDSVGTSDAGKQDIETLERAGCKMQWFNSPRWYSIEELNYRTHRKILVIDGETGFTGGASVADHWLGNAQDKDHWRDTQFKVTGAAARLLEAGFYENWVEAGGEVAPALDPSPERVPQDDRTLVAWSSPTGGSNSMKLLYLLTLAAAEKRIDISSPYFITDESTMSAIEAAVKRGVKVRILTEGDVTDAKPVKFASRDAYDHLMTMGVEIYEYQPTMMHVKALLVDGIWSIVGSTNFDNRSLELNDELNLGVRDPGLAARLTSDFEQDLRRSHRIDLDEWRKRPIHHKARERMWALFGEVF
jgi:cardiolipin synthase A/B